MGKKYADGGQVKADDIVPPKPTDSVQAPSLSSVDGSTGFAGGLATGISNGRAMKEYKTQVDARKPKAMANGGSVSDKELGLKASSGEKVGFWQRIKMGNIDQEGSKASEAFGAGRGRAERQMDQLDKDMAPARAKPVAPAKDDMPSMESERAGSRAVAGTPAAPAAPKKSVPTKAVAATPPKPSASTARPPAPAPSRPAEAPAPARPAAAAAPAAKKTAQRTRYHTPAPAPVVKKSQPPAPPRPEEYAGNTFLAAQDKFRRPEEYANGGMVGGNRSYGKKC